MGAGGRSVFFSCSSKDRKISETICAALEARGFSCWLATRDVRPGENYQTAIVQAIKAAKVLLLVFSSNTNASDEIKKELSLASKQRLLVIPVRVEDVLPDEAISYELATRQWIDLFAGWEGAMSRLAEQLTTVVLPQPTPMGHATTVAPPEFSRRLVIPKWTIAAGIAAVLAVGAFVYFPRAPHPVEQPRQPASVPSATPTTPPSVQAMMRCMQADAELAIKGCTANLADPKITGSTRAGYFKFRGLAYARTFDYDKAVADFTNAIALMPQDGSNYFLRATARRAKGDQAGADADDAKAKALGYTPPR